MSKHLRLLRYTVLLESPHDKTNNVAVRPAKNQNQTGYLVCAQWVAKYLSFIHSDSKASDQTVGGDAQADLSLRWAHMPLCWFCHEVAHSLNPSPIWVKAFITFWCYFDTVFLIVEEN